MTKNTWWVSQVLKVRAFTEIVCFEWKNHERTIKKSFLGSLASLNTIYYTKSPFKMKQFFEPIFVIQAVFATSGSCPNSAKSPVFSLNQGKSTPKWGNFTKVSVLNSRWAPLTTLFVWQVKVMKIINLQNFHAIDSHLCLTEERKHFHPHPTTPQPLI